MKLTYRGVAYESQPQAALELDTLDQFGTYRGQAVQFRYPRHIPAPAHIHDLMYRGVAYRNDGSQPVRPLPQVRVASRSATAPVAQVRPNLWIAPVNAVEAAQRIHHDHLLQRLNQRIEAARAQGNEWLLAQLEEERHQLNLI